MVKKPMTTRQAQEMIRDIATNSYETGYERGFAEAKRRIRNGSIVLLVWVLFIFCLWMLVSCAPVAEVGAGYEVDGNMVGAQPSATIYLGLETTASGPLSASCGYFHLSHVREGTPFNHNPETWSDQARCAVRYSWKDR